MSTNKSNPTSLRVLQRRADGSRLVGHGRCGRTWTERRPLLHCCACVGEYTTADEFRWHRRQGGGTCPMVETTRRQVIA